jgi:hypothetical protein
VSFASNSTPRASPTPSSVVHGPRDDGVTYQDYVTELTFLLFLKMMQETDREDRIPAAYRWAGIAKREGTDQLDHYRRALLDLGKAPDARVKAIFTDAQTKLRRPANLKALTTAIDALDWFSARKEGLGDLYEGLLEKNASEKKSGAGQYFMPRPLIDCIVRLMQPKPGEVVQDPAAGRNGRISCRGRSLHQGRHGRPLQAVKGRCILPAQQRLHRHRAGARDAPARIDEPDASQHRQRDQTGPLALARRGSSRKGRPHPHQSPIRHQERGGQIGRTSQSRPTRPTNSLRSSNTSCAPWSPADAPRSCCPITCCSRTIPGDDFVHG